MSSGLWTENMGGTSSSKIRDAVSDIKDRAPNKSKGNAKQTENLYKSGCQ
jgi:hypothetical protein